MARPGRMGKAQQLEYQCFEYRDWLREPDRYRRAQSIELHYLVEPRRWSRWLWCVRSREWVFGKWFFRQQ